MSMTEMAQEVVSRGAALLDNHVPGWRAKIVTEDFTIASNFRCVLGQVYGYYGKGMDELLPHTAGINISGELLEERVCFSASHGFSTRDVDLEVLDAAWIAEIKGREVVGV